MRYNSWKLFNIQCLGVIFMDRSTPLSMFEWLCGVTGISGWSLTQSSPGIRESVEGMMGFGKICALALIVLESFFFLSVLQPSFRLNLFHLRIVLGST